MVVIVSNNHGSWTFIVWNILAFTTSLNINLYLDKNINKNKSRDTHVPDNTMQDQPTMINKKNDHWIFKKITIVFIIHCIKETVFTFLDNIQMLSNLPPVILHPYLENEF